MHKIKHTIQQLFEQSPNAENKSERSGMSSKNVCDAVNIPGKLFNKNEKIVTFLEKINFSG